MDKSAYTCEDINKKAPNNNKTKRYEKTFLSYKGIYV